MDENDISSDTLDTAVETGAGVQEEVSQDTGADLSSGEFDSMFESKESTQIETPPDGQDIGAGQTETAEEVETVESLRAEREAMKAAIAQSQPILDAFQKQQFEEARAKDPMYGRVPEAVAAHKAVFEPLADKVMQKFVDDGSAVYESTYMPLEQSVVTLRDMRLKIEAGIDVDANELVEALAAAENKTIELRDGLKKHLTEELPSEATRIARVVGINVGEETSRFTHNGIKEAETRAGLEADFNAQVDGLDKLLAKAGYKSGIAPEARKQGLDTILEMVRDGRDPKSATAAIFGAIKSGMDAGITAGKATMLRQNTILANQNAHRASGRSNGAPVAAQTLSNAEFDALFTTG